MSERSIIAAKMADRLSAKTATPAEPINKDKFNLGNNILISLNQSQIGHVAALEVLAMCTDAILKSVAEIAAKNPEEVKEPEKLFGMVKGSYVDMCNAAKRKYRMMRQTGRD